MNVERYTTKPTKNLQTETRINDQHADAILSNRANYVHALSPVKRVLDYHHWLIPAGPKSNEYDNKQTKNLFRYLNLHVILLSGQNKC